MVDTFPHGISARVKEIRKTLKLSQREVADSLLVTVQAISDIERGVNGLSMKMFAHLVQKYNVNAYYLLWGYEPIFNHHLMHHQNDTKFSTDAPGGSVASSSKSDTGALMASTVNLFREKVGISEKTRQGLQLILVETAANEMDRLQLKLDGLTQIEVREEHDQKDLEDQKAVILSKIEMVKNELKLLLRGDLLPE